MGSPDVRKLIYQPNYQTIATDVAFVFLNEQYAQPNGFSGQRPAQATAARADNDQIVLIFRKILSCERVLFFLLKIIYKLLALPVNDPAGNFPDRQSTI